MSEVSAIVSGQVVCHPTVKSLMKPVDFLLLCVTIIWRVSHLLLKAVGILLHSHTSHPQAVKLVYFSAQYCLWNMIVSERLHKLVPPDVNQVCV